MSDKFRETIGKIDFQPRTFAEILRKSVNVYIDYGRSGIDRRKLDKNGEPHGPEDTVRREFYMDEKIFELGCKIHESGVPLNPKLWSAWMRNTHYDIQALRKEGDPRTHTVTFYQRSAFCNDHTDKALGKILQQYFGRDKKLIFIPDESIRQHVEAA